MRGQRVSKFFEQDKGVRRLTRNSAPERAEFAATLKPSYSAVLRHRWPLIALLLCTSTAWGTHRFGIRINGTPSAPRGIYRLVDSPPIRGSLVGICLPRDVARVAREPRIPRSRRLSGRSPDGRSSASSALAATSSISPPAPSASTVDRSRTARRPIETQRRARCRTPNGAGTFLRPATFGSSERRIHAAGTVATSAL